MGGIKLGAFLGGAVDGYNTARKRAAEEERLSWERDEQDEKKKAREARSEFSASMEKLRQDRANGMLAGGEDNLTENGIQHVQSYQQKATAPKQTAIAAPADAAPAEAPAQQQTAIAVPGAAPAPQQAPAPQENRVANPFKSSGEGLYKNQRLADDAYYNGVRDITARYLERTGQMDKLATLDKQINDMRESAYDPIRKAAAAALATGQPNAMKLAAHAMSLSGIPVQFDETSGVYDAKSQMWKGVKSRGADGKERVEDMHVTQMLTAINSLDPARLVEFTVGRGDKERELSIKEKDSESQRITANASATRAGAEKTYYEARARATDQDIKGANAKALQETLGKHFPLANSEIDPTKSIGKSPDDLKKRQAQIDADTKGLAVAERLAGLNPKLDPRVVGAASKQALGGGMSEQTDQKTGRKYIEYGGTKIYTN